MKNIITLCFFAVLATLCHGHSASLSANEDIQTHIIELFAKLRFARGGTSNIQCYDKYLPSISKIGEQSKIDNAACSTTADSQKEDALGKVQNQRENLDNKVKTIQATLTSCTEETDIIKYLNCLKDKSAENKAAIDEIVDTSSKLSGQLGREYTKIEKSQDMCVSNVITKSKEDINNIFASLQYCLLNGFDTPDPENPENPQDPENPENPQDPENPENPQDPENPENPQDPANPENPQDPENPENPQDPENPENPQDPENPENPQDPENPENPQDPENPENPQDPENPENPQDPDNSGNSNSGSDNTNAQTSDSSSDSNAADKNQPELMPDEDV